MPPGWLAFLLFLHLYSLTVVVRRVVALALESVHRAVRNGRAVSAKVLARSVAWLGNALDELSVLRALHHWEFIHLLHCHPPTHKTNSILQREELLISHNVRVY